MFVSCLDLWHGARGAVTRLSQIVAFARDIPAGFCTLHWIAFCRERMPFALACAARTVVMIGIFLRQRGVADLHFVFARDFAARAC